MSAFRLPVTLRLDGTTVRVTLRLSRPMPWSAVGPVLCRAAGLPAKTVLYRGVGPVEPDWIVGAPPLLAGCVLALLPDDEPPANHPLVLAVMAGRDAGSSVPVHAAALIVGRDPAADLCLTDPATSWRHLRLSPAPTGLAVHDLGSTNGSRVDGVEVDERATATTGSVIRIGNTVLQVQLTAERGGAFRPDGRGCAVRMARTVEPPPPPVTLPPRPSPPVAPDRHALPLLSALIGAAVGTGLAIALRNPLYLAFAAFGPVTMIGSAIGDRLRGRRSFRRQRRDYRRTLAEWERGATRAADLARRRAWRTWPGPAELLRRAEAGSALLWLRSAQTGITLATGCRAGPPPVPPTGASDSSAGNTAGPPPPGPLDVPTTTTLSGVVGLVGARGRASARFVLAQLACHYSPADLVILAIGCPGDLAGGDGLAPVCAELPHTIPIARDATYAEIVAAVAGRRMVAVLDGVSAARDPCAAAVLAAAAPAGDCAADAGRQPIALCLADSVAALPESARIGGRLLHDAGATEMGATQFRRLCHALAPLRDGQRRGAAIPAAIDLASLTGPVDVDTVRRRWRHPRAVATLGASTDGPATIDLDADGPHLLIAGTTGAGKSELLTTLITSLAVAAPPRHTTFLLVDYKGGSAFTAIQALPHVVGVLTDLNAAESARALTGLRAELHRREEASAAGAPPAAKLIIVVDEFATLAVELPEFLSGVLDIAQRGRSLGLHLILATQRPAGVVSPAMRANISARICLRVTDPAESVDVVGVAAAASIPPQLPGRAILAVGGRRVAFQTARVTIPAPADIAAWIDDPPHTRAGGKSLADPEAASTPTDGSQPPTILAAVVTATRAAALGDASPATPWLPPLPARIAAPTDSAALGLADRPDRQRQDLVAAPQASTLITGPAGSGRTWALRRIATIAAQTGEEIIVIDGADGLRDLASWPAVSSHLTVREPRLIIRLLTLLADPARRPGDGHRRHVFIDHLDIVLAELERSDYVTGAAALFELGARASGTVRLTAAGSVRLENHRVATLFSEAITLTGQVPGRATWSGVDLQIVACPADGAIPRSEIPAALRELTIVRRLPDSVPVAQLPAPIPSAVPIGLGGDAAQPCCVDLGVDGGAIVVAGPRGSGVSHAVSLFVRQAAACGIPVIRVVTQRHPAAGGGAAAPVDSGAVNSGAADSGAADPRGATGDGARGGGFPRTIDCAESADPLTAALREHEGPLLLAVDHDVIADDHPAAAVLERFLSVCGTGQHLVLGARTAAVARARRGLLHTAIASRRALLFAPDPADGAPFDVTIPRRRWPTAPGRGLWIDGAVSLPIQVAS